MAVRKDYPPSRLVLDFIIVAILEKGIKRNFPPAGFDPLEASQEELDEFHLPLRPDPIRAPRSLANWLRAMSKPLFFPDDKLTTAELFTASPLRSLHQHRGTSTVTQESSQNWSGGYARPRNFDAMTLVEARWTVPLPAPAGPGNGTFASSAWVGLDGHDPASRSLPQIGTGHYVTVTAGVAVPDLFAWWEWWGRDDPHKQQIRIAAVPVMAGDTVYARIHALGPKTVRLFIKNETTGQAIGFDYTVQTPVAVGPNPLPPHVEGRTADWILERPALPDHQPIKLFTLADYGEATFCDCNAATGDGALQRELDLRRARLIRMNVWDDKAEIGHVVSQSQRKGDDKLQLRYL
jgi:hypothetical protein